LYYLYAEQVEWINEWEREERKREKEMKEKRGETLLYPARAELPSLLAE